MSIAENIQTFKKSLPGDITLVAVSKTKPVNEIVEAYNAGQRVFGENKIQEMEAKWQEMPKDISWHMIGHVQRNKVKYMAPFVSLIHAVDSLKLLKEINKQALKNDRIINCLLQIKIAEEDSKFGMLESDALSILNSEEIRSFQNIKVIGLMGMATFTDDEDQIRAEFQKLKTFYDKVSGKFDFSELSMGMSSDYGLAIEKGSTMVRVGSAIFGERNY
tara:strand:- start:52422 stop:53075 length:654 start_codon:yes stop_codon:yes gene_type:complete